MIGERRRVLVQPRSSAGRAVFRKEKREAISSRGPRKACCRLDCNPSSKQEQFWKAKVSFHLSYDTVGCYWEAMVFGLPISPRQTAVEAARSGQERRGSNQ